MAESEAKLVVTLVDKASAALKDIAGKVRGFSDIFFAAKAAVGAFSQTFGTSIQFLKDSLNAYAENESAIVKLTNALKNQGITSQSAVDDLVKYADKLEKLTGVNDDVLISMQALLTTFGLTGDKMNEALVAATDLSIARSIDLRTATLLLGKAFVGETAALSRFGIQIDDNIPKGKRFQEVLDQINGSMGGAAAAQTRTYAGQVNLLALAFDDLQKAIGKELNPATTQAIALLTKFVDIITSAIPTAAAIFKSSMGTMLGALGPLGTGLKVGAGAVDVFFRSKAAKAKKSANETVSDIESETVIVDEKYKQQTEALQKKHADEEQSRLDSANKRIEEFGLTEQQIQNKQMESDIVKLNMQGESAKAAELFDLLEKKKAQDRQKTMSAFTVNALNQLAAFQGAKSKEIAGVAKAAAIAQATMSTYQAASGALSTPPVGPWNFAIAAAFIAAGLANVAQISGVKLARGGVVMPTSGGVTATVAEAGRPEAVIPLGDDRATEQIREAIGGEGLSITIQAGVLVADQMSVENFAREIDKALFDMKRNRESLSLG